MKKCLLAAVVLGFCLPVIAQAQSASNAAAGNPATKTPQSSSTKLVTLSGKVSADAKWIATAHKANFEVVNPELLSAHAGQIVTVKCEKDPTNNTIRIVAVKSARQDTTGVARLDDAAFRR